MSLGNRRDLNQSLVSIASHQIDTSGVDPNQTARKHRARRLQPGCYALFRNKKVRVVEELDHHQWLVQFKDGSRNQSCSSHQLTRIYREQYEQESELGDDDHHDISNDNRQSDDSSYDCGSTGLISTSGAGEEEEKHAEDDDESSHQDLPDPVAVRTVFEDNRDNSSSTDKSDAVESQGALLNVSWHADFEEEVSGINHESESDNDHDDSANR